MQKILVLLILAAPFLMMAQYSVNHKVLSESGGASSGGAYSIKGTLGQTAVGQSSGDGYTVSSGFWYGVNSIEEPALSTDSVTAIAVTGAFFHGTISADGGEDSFRRGFFYKVYDGNGNSESDDYVDESGSFGTGSFSLEASALSAETRYSVSAFAENSTGIGMAERLDFWTLSMEPGSHATEFYVDSVLSSKTARLGFSPASEISGADGYIIIARRNAMPTALPEDGTGYELGEMIGQSKVVAIVDNTSDVLATATGLAENSNYYFLLIPYNYNGSEWATVNYYTDPEIPSANAATPIPTLTEWALMSLLMAMAGFGLFKLRQS